MPSRDGSFSSREGTGSPRPPDAAAFSATKNFCRSLVKTKLFGAFIQCTIAFSTITFAMDDIYVERDNSHQLHKVVQISDWAILLVFTIEMFLKMYAWGLRRRALDENTENVDLIAMIAEDFESQGYFSNNWNTFDFIIVFVSWITVPLTYTVEVNSSVGSVVRAARAMRPLRALQFLEGAQDVLKTFPNALESMIDGFLLVALVLFVYAILGVNLFGVNGNFHGRCVVDDPNNTHGTRGFLQKDVSISDIICGDEKCQDGFRCSWLGHCLCCVLRRVCTLNPHISAHMSGRLAVQSTSTCTHVYIKYIHIF
jgi:hypothetical protein